MSATTRRRTTVASVIERTIAPMPTPVLAHGERLLNEQEAAQILGVVPGTLTVWRCTRRYPLPFVRVGRAVRYRRTDIEAFITSRTVAPVTP